MSCQEQAGRRQTVVFDEILGSSSEALVKYTSPKWNKLLGHFDALGVQVTAQLISHTGSTTLTIKVESSATEREWAYHNLLINKAALASAGETVLFGQSTTANAQSAGRLAIELPAGLIVRIVIVATVDRDGGVRFSPLTLPGLVAVHDAMEGATSAQWNDLSGHGHHATQGLSNLQPTVVADDGDAAPAILFDAATDDQYAIPAQAALADSNYTVYALFRPTAGRAGGEAYCLWGQGNSGNALAVNYILFINDAPGSGTGYLITSHRDDAGVQAEFTNSASLLAGEWHIAVLRRDGASFYLRADDTVSTSSAANPGTTTMNQAFIGKNGQGGGIPCLLDGRMRHLGLFDVAHTDQQVDEYLNYLRRRFPGLLS